MEGHGVNGSTSVSKTESLGSNPSAPAIPSALVPTAIRERIGGRRKHPGVVGGYGDSELPVLVVGSGLVVAWNLRARTLENGVIDV